MGFQDSTKNEIHSDVREIVRDIFRKYSELSDQEIDLLYTKMYSHYLRNLCSHLLNVSSKTCQDEILHIYIRVLNKIIRCATPKQTARNVQRPIIIIGLLSYERKNLADL
jgi:hypothetical protein